MPETQQVNDTTTTTEVAETEVSQLVKTLLDDASKLQTLYKNWVGTVKKLTKEMEREKKKLAKQKPKRKVNQKPQAVTSEMQGFMKKHAPKEIDGVAVQHNGSYTRQVMMKSVSNYIKTHKIQNEANRKQWSGKDKVLKKLFKLDSEWYTFMQINGLLSRVVVKA